MNGTLRSMHGSAMRAAWGVTLLIVTSAAAPPLTLAQSKPWTSVGSTGTVDEADQSLAEFTSGRDFHAVDFTRPEGARDLIRAIKRQIGAS